jgi:anti-sigma factor ChrR (cupin superfamily)
MIVYGTGEALMGLLPNPAEAAAKAVAAEIAPRLDAILAVLQQIEENTRRQLEIP